MTSDSSFEILIEQLRRRDNTAATQVFSRFAKRLIALARSAMYSGEPMKPIRAVLHELLQPQRLLAFWQSLPGLS